MRSYAGILCKHAGFCIREVSCFSKCSAQLPVCGLAVFVYQLCTSFACADILCADGGAAAYSITAAACAGSLVSGRICFVGTAVIHNEKKYAKLILFIRDGE